jgi:hypothetical protein
MPTQVGWASTFSIEIGISFDAEQADRRIGAQGE